MAGKWNEDRNCCVQYKTDDSTLKDIFIMSFSYEWRDLIRIFLCFENPCEKAEKWLERKYVRAAATLGPQALSTLNTKPHRQPSYASTDDHEDPFRLPLPEWHELVTDLLEKVPLLNGPSITNKERILCMPTNLLKHMLVFLCSHKDKIDGDVFGLLSSFLQCNMHKFDEWCRLVIRKGFLHHSGSGKELFSTKKQEYFAANFSTMCLSAGNCRIQKLTNTAREYIGVQDTDEHLIPWKIGGCFDDIVTECTEDDNDELKNLNIERHVEKEGSRNLLKVSPDIPVVEDDTAHFKKAKLDSDVETEDIISEKNSENEQNNHATGCPLTSKVVPFRELMNTFPDFKIICTELSTILSQPEGEIDHICNCLGVDDLTEGQVIYFLSCVCSDEAAISSHTKTIILQKSLLRRLVNLEKTASRQVYNFVIQLLKCNSDNSKECIHAVIAPLLLQSSKNSLQEDFILKILKSDSLGTDTHCQVLQCVLELYRKEKQMSESFVKMMEISLEKKLKIPSALLFDTIYILKENVAKFEEMNEVPKLIIAMIKQYKEEVIEITSTVEELLSANRSFLKKRALKELAKICQ